MRVILRDSTKGLGEIGDVIQVKVGFARNYLFPQKKALPETKENLKIVVRLKERKKIKEESVRQEALLRAKKIEGCSLTILAEAGEDERLFGAVTREHIAEAIKKEGVSVDKKHIQLEAPIKKLGIYDININVFGDIDAKVKVFVMKK